MAWCAASGSVKFRQDDGDELTGLVSPIDSSITHDELNKGGKKRLHYRTAKDEVKDDDDDDLSEHLSNATEKKRRLTSDQVNFLERSFNMDLKLEPERKCLIAKQLGIGSRQVAIWFQNRRARWKNKQLEQDFEVLKTQYDALLKEKELMLQDHDTALEENKQLQTEVSKLTELLNSRENDGDKNEYGAGPELGPVTEQASIRSEVTSPTKSFEDQSEVQDSGQSRPPPTREAVPGLELNEVCFFKEPNPWCTYVEGAPLVLADDFLGSFPYPVQFAVSGLYQDDGCNLLFNHEDRFMG